MTRLVACGCLLGALMVALMAGPALADDKASSPSGKEQAIGRLEALLEAQQRQIETLEQQVAAAQQAGADAQRVEVMRKQIRDILSEQEFRESLMPSMLQAGYDDGFFIHSSDDKFLMKINGGMQFRWTYYETRARNHYLSPRRERDDMTGFDLQRTRLALSGHAYTKDLTYNIELRADAPDGYDAVVDGAWINYRIADEFQVRAGIFGLESTRQESVYVLDQQQIDRSLTDAVFSLGTGLGVKLWGQLFDKRLEYHLTVVNSLADGRNAGLGRTITPDEARELDNNPAILFRTVWHALGEDPEKDFANMHDLPKHQSPAWDFAFRYAFNQDDYDRFTTRIPFPRWTILPGGFGLTNTNGMQINQFGLDTCFKWMGFSATGEYIVRVVDPTRVAGIPYTPWYVLSGDDSTTAQHGAYVQLGYFLPIAGLEDKLEVIARVGGISTLAEDTEATWEYSAGVNYYFNKDVKLQADITKISEVPISNNYSSLANVNDDALIFRVQLQVAF